MIFFQGLDDKVVPPNQAEAMVAVLRAKKLPVAYVAFPGEQHGFRKADNIVRALEAELDFFGRILGFTPADSIEPGRDRELSAASIIAAQAARDRVVARRPRGAAGPRRWTPAPRSTRSRRGPARRSVGPDRLDRGLQRQQDPTASVNARRRDGASTAPMPSDQQHDQRLGLGESRGRQL